LEGEFVRIKLLRVESSPDEGKEGQFVALFEVEAGECSANIHIHVPAAGIDEADVIRLARDLVSRLASDMEAQTRSWRIDEVGRANLDPPVQSTQSAIEAGGVEPCPNHGSEDE
jgi:hypothetical protein